MISQEPGRISPSFYFKGLLWPAQNGLLAYAFLNGALILISPSSVSCVSDGSVLGWFDFPRYVSYSVSD